MRYFYQSVSVSGISHLGIERLSSGLQSLLKLVMIQFYIGGNKGKDLETKQHSYRLLRLTAWTIPVFMMKVVEMLEVEVRVADCLIVSVKLHVQIGHPELTHLVGTLLVL